MKTNVSRNLLSAFAVAFFFIIATASSVNKIHCGAFNTSNAVEKLEDNDNFAVKNDGTILYGEKISWTSGLLLKDQVKVDDQKFKTSEIRGYVSKGIFYGRYKNEFVKRIIRGKLNVYFYTYTSMNTSTSTSGMMRTTQETHCMHLVQKGEKGELTPLANQDDIKAAVADCPKAAAMIDISSKKVRKAIRNDRNFLNSIFDLYNNNCK